MAAKNIAVLSMHLAAAGVAAKGVGQRPRQPPAVRERGLATIMSGVVAVGEAILIALAVPIVILVVGSPIALLVGLVLEIARALCTTPESAQHRAR